MLGSNRLGDSSALIHMWLNISAMPWDRASSKNHAWDV